MANNSNNIEGEGSTSRKDLYDISSRKTRHYGMTGSVQYGLSVTQAHTRSHALQSCWFPVGGFHPQGTETELLRRRANQQPPTAASPGGCGRPRWEPGVDAPDDPKGLCWIANLSTFFLEESIFMCHSGILKIIWKRFFKEFNPSRGQSGKIYQS